MLTRFEVENYKNFKNKLVLDLENSGGYQFNSDSIYKNIISKLLVYGKNSSGKTNLGKAIMDISSSPYFISSDNYYINADNINETAKFKYCFKFDDKYIEYYYEKNSEMMLSQEKLSIDNELIYFIDYDNFSKSSTNLSAINMETLVIDKFFEAINSSSEDEDDKYRRPSFLRWISANSVLDEDSVIISLVKYIENMTMVTVSNLIRNPHPRSIQMRLFSKFDESWVKELEHFFNQMGVECELILKTLPDGEKQLYFNHETPILFFETASSGTLALYNLYRRVIVPAKEASLLFLDEYDAFYHYELSRNVFKYLRDNYPKTQIIFTTHNINLMTNKITRPDCLFILSLDGRLTSLNNATGRELRQGHNIEKLYVSGEFEDYE